MPLVECGHPSLKAEIGALGRKVETYDTTDHEHSGISSLRIEVTTLLLIINFKLRQLKTLALLTPDYFSKLAHTPDYQGKSRHTTALVRSTNVMMISEPELTCLQ